MLKTKRVAAYGILTDDERILAQESAPGSILPGSWWLPGGTVEHGEHPAETVLREFAAETGLTVRVVGLREVSSTVVPMSADHAEHNTLFLYDVERVDGELSPTVADGHARNVWIRPQELTGRPMSPITATMLDVDGGELLVAGARPVPSPTPGRRQRVGVYAWITGPDERVLLTLIREGFPGEGQWHLAGGGLNFGEQPLQTLLREIAEETSQDVVLTRQPIVASHHDPTDPLPGGESHEDYHGVHVIYRGRVEVPKPLEITDVDGSTVEARWFDPAEIADLWLSPAAASAHAAFAVSRQ